MPKPSAPMTLTAFETLVETFGADSERWPASLRAQGQTLLASSTDARQSVAEAQALERALDLAPVVGADRAQALAARIVQAALASRGASRASEQVAGAISPRLVPVAARPTNVVAFPGSRATPVSRFKRPAAALMAASLMLGIIVGSSGLSTTAGTIVADALGLSDDEAEYASILDAGQGGDEIL